MCMTYFYQYSSVWMTPSPDMYEANGWPSFQSTQYFREEFRNVSRVKDKGNWPVLYWFRYVYMPSRDFGLECTFFHPCRKMDSHIERPHGVVCSMTQRHPDCCFVPPYHAILISISGSFVRMSVEHSLCMSRRSGIRHAVPHLLLKKRMLLQADLNIKFVCQCPIPDLYLSRTYSIVFGLMMSFRSFILKYFSINAEIFPATRYVFCGSKPKFFQMFTMTLDACSAFCRLFLSIFW